MSGLDGACEVVVRLGVELRDTLQTAATVAQIPFEQFVREVLEAEAAARRLPAPISKDARRVVKCPPGVKRDDMSGPTASETYRWCLHG
jgi:hypothetical protein